MGCSRYFVLDDLFLIMTVRVIFYLRKEKIIQDWLKLLQRLSARKKSLVAIQGVAAFVQDIEDLELELNGFKVDI